jgi:SAM-dependent methyltransferase
LTANEFSHVVTDGPVHRAALDVLVCPACNAGLEVAASGAALVCLGCRGEVALRRGIPRFLSALDVTAARTQASFGYEWAHFDDWTASGDTNFQQYFGDLDLTRLKDARVLDAGCGMGRHARLLGPHVRELIALDFSDAIDRAAGNLADLSNTSCVQADVTAPPLRPESFDLVYSLGVLHHLQDTSGAVSKLARLVRPGGRLRVYLYWQPGGWRGSVLALVNICRRVTTRLPFGVLRALCWMLSVGLWTGVVAPYRILWRLGVRGVTGLPLFQYTMYPFAILYNDQFDRFSAPLEKRYRPEEVRDLLEAAGLVDVRVWPRYGWMAEGVKPHRAMQTSTN